MALTKAQALLVAAKSMDLFVAEKLLVKDQAGNVVVSDSAPDVKIDLLLKDLDADDKTYGLHAIRFILLSLKDDCAALQHTLNMTSVDLLDDSQVQTIDDLAVLVKVRAKK